MSPRGGGSTIALLEPLLRAANGHSEKIVAFNPVRWNVVNLVLEALGGEWDVRLRISPDIPPSCIYLMDAAALTLDRVAFSHGRQSSDGRGSPKRLETTAERPEN